MPPPAALSAPTQSVDVLNFALRLEYLEATFYSGGVKRLGLTGEAKDLARTLRDNEVEHVDALKATIKQLGGAPATAPRVDFDEASENRPASSNSRRRSRTRVWLLTTGPLRH